MIPNFLRKVRDELATTDNCLVSLQVGNKGGLQTVGENETRIVVVDKNFQTATITDDEWADEDRLADEIISMMLKQRKMAR